MFSLKLIALKTKNMNTLSFSQKNDLVVKHKDKKGFWKDLELFKKHFPSHRLMNDLARANDFTCERLDGQMLYLLLDKLSVDNILKNREAKEQAVPEQPLAENLSNEKLEELSNRLEELKDDVETNENDIYDLQSELEDKNASIDELHSKIEAIENKVPDKKKDKAAGISLNSVDEQLES